MKKFADVRGVQVSSVGSQDMNDEIWVKLALEVNRSCGSECAIPSAGILRFDMVIAGIDVAVVLDGRPIAPRGVSESTWGNMPWDAPLSRALKTAKRILPVKLRIISVEISCG